MAVKDWSTSALSNTSVGGVNIAEGCDRRNMNDMGRAIMAEAKAKFNEMVSVKDYGAVGNGVTDDTASIQAAMDAYDYVYFPAGTYNITTLRFKRNNQVIYGAGFGATVLSSNIATGGSSVIANNTPGTTLIGCEIRDMKVIAASLSIGYVVDWQHMQLGRIERVWVFGGGDNCIAFALGATWTVTECTYNTVVGCYSGNVLKGIALGDGANSNTFINCRSQPAYASGYGFFLFGSGAGRISNNVIIGGGTEYPGNVSNGIYLGIGADATTITGHRFESMATAITIATGALDTQLLNNYYSSCTFNVTDAGTRTTRFDGGKLYSGGSQVIGPRDTGWTAGTGTALKGAFASYAGATVSAAYVQAEAQATDNAVKNTSQRVKALEDAMRTHGLIN